MLEAKEELNRCKVSIIVDYSYASKLKCKNDLVIS